MHYFDKDERHRGDYKIDSNRVVAFDASEKEVGTIFEIATPFDTPRLMKELVEWTNDNFQDGYIHPIQNLVKQSILMKNGSTKSAYYILK